MELSSYLTNRLKEVLTEGEWVVGTNFKAEIINLNWLVATQKVERFNTIADITFHIHYYIKGVAEVLKGGALNIKDAFSFNAPPITSQEHWQNLVQNFCNDSEVFIKLVENMSNEALLSDFVNPKYGTYLRNIDVLIEHTYYHLGQIILIKKKIQ